jgi:hypothetical protein
MNDCRDFVQTTASKDVGGQDLAVRRIEGTRPVINEPSHKLARVGLRKATILVTMFKRLLESIEGMISSKGTCSHSLTTLQSIPGSQNVPHNAENIVRGIVLNAA